MFVLRRSELLSYILGKGGRVGVSVITRGVGNPISWSGGLGFLSGPLLHTYLKSSKKNNLCYIQTISCMLGDQAEHDQKFFLRVGWFDYVTLIHSVDGCEC